MLNNSLDQMYATSGFVFGKASNLLDFDVAKQVSETLNKHYPGYMWAVNVESETGMVQVRNFSLSGIWGFNLHLRQVQEDIHGKLIINAGGEILERFRVRVGKANNSEMEGMKTNEVGLYVPDTTGAK